MSQAAAIIHRSIIGLIDLAFHQLYKPGQLGMRGELEIIIVLRGFKYLVISVATMPPNDTPINTNGWFLIYTIR